MLGKLDLNHGYCEGVTYFLSVDVQAAPLTATIVDHGFHRGVDEGRSAGIGEIVTLQLTRP